MNSSGFPVQLLGFALILVFLLAACQNGEEPADPLIAEGKRLYNRNCASCHSLKPERVITGPSLAGIASHAGGRQDGLGAQEYLRLSITDPATYLVEGFSDLMPDDFPNKLDREELDALVAFLMTQE